MATFSDIVLMGAELDAGIKRDMKRLDAIKKAIKDELGPGVYRFGDVTVSVSPKSRRVTLDRYEIGRRG